MSDTDTPAPLSDAEIEELVRLYSEAVPFPQAGKWKRVMGTVLMMDESPWDKFCESDGTLRVERANFVTAMINSFYPLIDRLRAAEAERDALIKIPTPDEIEDAASMIFTGDDCLRSKGLGADRMRLIAMLRRMHRQICQLESERDRLRAALCNIRYECAGVREDERFNDIHIIADDALDAKEES